MRIEDFFNYVDQSGGSDACWPWLKGHHSAGYGSVHIGEWATLAHIVALEIASGEKANGRHALHSCDNPPCCNPKHLFWGTQANNIADMDKKGRRGTAPGKKGETAYNAKLTDADAAHIRAIYVPYDPLFGGSALARKYEVSQRCVSEIVRGKRYVIVP